MPAINVFVWVSLPIRIVFDSSATPTLPMLMSLLPVLNIKTGSNDISIGNVGVADESNTIRMGNETHTNTFIAGISGVTVPGGVGVIIDTTGHLGTTTSS